MKFITVDASGNIMGMFLSEDHISREDENTSIELSDEDWESVGPGYVYVNGSLIPPPPKTPEEIQAEKNAGKIAANTAKKAQLIAAATDRISVLQDAVDLDMATADEIAALPLWKKYRVLLSRVDANTSDDVAWTETPAK